MHNLVPTRTRRMLLAVSTAVAAALAVPALASAACPATPTAKVFSQWGDANDYSLLTGGSFESGTGGWTVSNGSVVSGNEPWKVGGAAHGRSLSVKAGGRATSPWFCLGFEHPTFRFFAKRTSTSWGGLTYSVRWVNEFGNTMLTPLGYQDGYNYGSWKPTPQLPLATSLPLWQAGQTLKAQLVIEAQVGGTGFQLDDVYIDPYVRG